MLRIKPMSGYEIKQAVDQSTRFFWAASYGQIYPQLRRLESEGLIEGEQVPARCAPAQRLHAHTQGRRSSPRLAAGASGPAGAAL